MKRIKVVEKLEIYKFGSVYFWYMIHPKKLRNLQKKSKVYTMSKVRGFGGMRLIPSWCAGYKIYCMIKPAVFFFSSQAHRVHNDVASTGVQWKQNLDQRFWRYITFNKEKVKLTYLHNHLFVDKHLGEF
jgi:hypothetical protein